VTIDHIVKEYGEERFVSEIQETLKNGTGLSTSTFAAILMPLRTRS
jgi:hypothetical protein